MDLGLRDRVALVTGASKGIGYATSMALASEGARVAMCARNPAVLKAGADTIRAMTRAEVLVVSADLSEREGVASAAQATLDHFGRIDVLVNNAGSIRMGDFLTIPDDQWIADWNLKVFGYVRMVRAVFPVMQRQGRGRIVNVIGATARHPWVNYLPGGAANAALVNFTKGLADLGAKWNILVTAVSPGGTQTERWEHLLEVQAGAQEKTVEQMRSEKMKTYPLGRLGTPEEIADLICFLASERASYITGVCITIDGGVTPGVHL